MITQRWQNHQRELDVQAELVDDSAIDLLSELEVPLPALRVMGVANWPLAIGGIEQAQDELISRVLTTTPRV
jgi:hypothetical protein